MKFDMSQAWNDAVTLLSNNRRLVVILAAAFLFLPSLATSIFAPATEIEAIGPSNPEELRAAMLAYMQAHWPIISGYALVTTMGTLAMLALLGRSQRPTVGEAIQIGATALVPYLAATLLLGLGAGLLIFLIGVIAAAAGIAVAALLGVLGAVALVVIAVRLSLIGPVMAIEGVMNPLTSIARSWNLVKGNTRYVAAFFLLLFVALLVLSVVAGMVIAVFGALAAEGAVSLWINAIFEGLIGAVGSSVFLAVYAAVHRQLAGDPPEVLSSTFD